MAKRVIRLTEQELSKVLSDILNMTGAFGRKEKKDNKDKDKKYKEFIRSLD